MISQIILYFATDKFRFPEDNQKNQNNEPKLIQIAKGYGIMQMKLNWGEYENCSC